MDAIYTTLGIPFGYVLRFIFEAVDNYGLALILFTLFARLLMIPTSIYQTKGTVKTQRLQPKIRRINAKYKGDQKKIQEETQALYQREGHNPMNMAACRSLSSSSSSSVLSALSITLSSGRSRSMIQQSIR